VQNFLVFDTTEWSTAEIEIQRKLQGGDFLTNLDLNSMQNHENFLILFTVQMGCNGEKSLGL
jgi:hypothetical protein